MSCGGKKSKVSTIVVRPMEQGKSKAGKVVLGTLEELNRHVPHEVIKEHMPWAAPKPWHRSHRYRDKHSTRRNAGRDLGNTWSSEQSVCGAVLKLQRKSVCGAVLKLQRKSDWGVDIDEECGDDWETSREVEKQGSVEGSDEGRRDGQRELSIWDIAKPAKVRGPHRRDRHGLVTVQETALEDDLDTASGGIGEEEDWVTVEHI